VVDEQVVQRFDRLREQTHGLPPLVQAVALPEPARQGALLLASVHCGAWDRREP
jgi:hypothetical protein